MQVRDYLTDEPYLCLFGEDVTAVRLYSSTKDNINKPYQRPGCNMVTLNDKLWSLGNFTPLMLASAKGLCDMVDCLLELGADVNVACREQRTALHYAVMFVNIDVITRLINAGANGHAIDALGKHLYIWQCGTISERPYYI